MSASNKYSQCFNDKKIQGNTVFGYSSTFQGGVATKNYFPVIFFFFFDSLFSVFQQTRAFYQKLDRRNYFELVSNQISLSFATSDFRSLIFINTFFSCSHSVDASEREIKIREFLFVCFESVTNMAGNGGGQS